MPEAVAQPASTNQLPAGTEITDVAPVSAVTNQQSLAEQAPAQSRMARAIARMTGQALPDATKAEPAKLDGVASGTPSEPEEPSEDPAEAKPEPGPEAPPAQKPGESDAKYQARLAQAMADLSKRDTAIREKDTAIRERDEAAKKLQADLDALRAEIAKRDKDPVYAMKPHGGFDAVAKRVLNQELKPPTAEEVIREQVVAGQSELETKLKELQDRLEAKERAENEARERAETERKTAETRASHLEVVKTHFAAAADRFPIAASYWKPESVLEYCYAKQIADPTKALEEIEAQTSTELEAILGNGRAVAAYLKTRPKVRETLLAALGGAAKEQSRKTPSSSEGPRAIGAEVVSAPTTPKDRPKTKNERMASAIARLTGGSQ